MLDKVGAVRLERVVDRHAQQAGGGDDEAVVFCKSWFGVVGFGWVVLEALGRVERACHAEEAREREREIEREQGGGGCARGV